MNSRTPFVRMTREIMVTTVSSGSIPSSTLRTDRADCDTRPGAYCSVGIPEPGMIIVFGLMILATANDVTRLPPELLRRGRFDELFFVDLPDLEARQEILTLHLARRGREPGRFDLPALAKQCEGYSGAELEQVVVGALHRAYALGRDVETQDLRRLGQDLVPLYRTYEEQIKGLREWARGRARTAGRESAVVDLFRKAGG